MQIRMTMVSMMIYVDDDVENDDADKDDDEEIKRYSSPVSMVFW